MIETDNIIRFSPGDQPELPEIPKQEIPQKPPAPPTPEPEGWMPIGEIW